MVGMQGVSEKVSGSVADNDIPRLLGIPFSLGMSLLYLVIASLWIFFSDRLIFLIAHNPRQLHLLSTGKGWFYVGLTSLLLFWCLERFTRQIRRSHKRIREDTGRHLTTLQAIGDAVLSTDVDGCIVMINPEAERLTGWSAGDAIGQPLKVVFRLISEDERQPIDYRLDRVVKDGEVIGLGTQALLVARDGTERPIADSAAPIRDADGHVNGIVLVFRDQSAERASGAALRANDRELKSAQRLAHIGSWCFDLNTGSVYGSDEARRIYGLGGDAWRIEDVQKIPLDAYRGLLDQALADLVRNGKPYDVEFQLRRPADGSVRHIHSIAEYDADRNRVIGTIHDITDRKQAEAARQDSEFRYLQLFEHAVDGILVGTPEGRIADANTSALRLLGLDKETLCGRHISTLFEQTVLQAVPLQFETLEQGGTVVCERRYIRPDGQVRHLEMHSKQMPDGGYHSIIRDITTRKHDESERERLQAQLMQSRKIESVGRLAGGVAHDFNNMLGVIIGYADLAMGKLEPRHALRGDLQEIMNAAQRSAEITSQLLAFARKQPIAPDVLDLNRTVEGILKMLRRLIGEHIDLDWNPSANIWPVRMDRSQVEQILTNLCLNARDAIHGSGRILIETEMVTLDQAACTGLAGLEPGSYVMLAVKDNGSGMDSEVLDSVFEPFFTTKDVGKGTGLGLATVYGIVKQNHGCIHVSSTPGTITTFAIYLPRCEDVPVDAVPGTLESVEGSAAGEVTILVAEDEPGILKLCETGLSELGYHVLAANSPEAAIELARSNAGRIDLLVSDVVMPGMNGKQLARAVESFSPGLKVLFMSGYSASVIAHHGVLAHGLHYVQKPFTIGSLARKVRQALDTGQAGHESV